MKKLILLLFVLSFTQILFAQNFRIIPENTERIFWQYSIEGVVSIESEPNSKQVQGWQLKNTTNQESLDLQKNIPAGMYVLWISNNGQKQYYSKVLVK